MWARWLNVLLGLWLLASPPVLGYGTSMAWYNDMIVGVAVAVVAAIAMVPRLEGARWINLLLGGWLLIVALSVNLGSAAMANDLTVGVLVAIFSAFGRGTEAKRIGEVH